ncbi:hypothetical protein BGW37DRAFT_523665 [Umbelopsis sp. PMI_123]|nr:hypothetical protein BGW37DRAFT_523665 [Umbelopsis sp. PMI_123]
MLVDSGFTYSIGDEQLLDDLLEEARSRHIPRNDMMKRKKQRCSIDSPSSSDMIYSYKRRGKHDQENTAQNSALDIDGLRSTLASRRGRHGRAKSITAYGPLTGNDDTGDVGRHGAIAAKRGVVGTGIPHGGHEAIGRVVGDVDGALACAVGGVDVEVDIKGSSAIVKGDSGVVANGVGVLKVGRNGGIEEVHVVGGDVGTRVAVIGRHDARGRGQLGRHFGRSRGNHGDHGDQGDQEGHKRLHFGRLKMLVSFEDIGHTYCDDPD